MPAVIPCGDCDVCNRDLGNICVAQKMPGNDIQGGVASHIVVPAAQLCEVPVDEDYKPVLDLVLEDKVKISPFTKRFPLSEINEVFEAVHSSKIQQRPVLIP